MVPETVIFAGYYGFGNAGDELILLSLISQWRCRDSQGRIVVLSNRPAETRDRFQVEAINRWRPWQWIGPLRAAHEFILGGGGLLQESTGPWNHLYYLSLLIVAKLFGCRTEVYRIGVDPIRSRFNRGLTRFVLNWAADRISVRDEVSKSALQEAGVKTPIEVQRDPVFELQTTPQPRLAKGTALAVSPWPGRPQWAEELAQLCPMLRTPVDFLILFPEQDEALARRVAGLSPAVRDVRIWNRPQDLMNWVGEYELVIATRFHALALAALHQKPFLALGNQPKVESLASQCGQPFWPFSRGWNREKILSILPTRERIDFPIQYANLESPI